MLWIRNDFFRIRTVIRSRMRIRLIVYVLRAESVVLFVHLLDKILFSDFLNFVMKLVCNPDLADPDGADPDRK